jgi:nitroreductase
MSNVTSIYSLALLFATAAAFTRCERWRDEAQREESNSQSEEQIGHTEKSRNKDAKQLDQSSILDVIRMRRSIFPKQYAAGKTVPKIVIKKMLEAARWAPTHNLTQPWRFIVYETPEGRQSVGRFLAEAYKQRVMEAEGVWEESANFKTHSKKFQKKVSNAAASSHIIAICVRRGGISKVADKIHEVEEICSVAMAVQNMHLIATEYGVGAYWSSGGIYEQSQKQERNIINPQKLRLFLELQSQNDFCLGWFFVGPFEGKMSAGKRKELDANMLEWK